MTSFISKSEKDTREFAKKFALELKPGSILCLFGDLGAGKTTFVQGLAKGLGIKDRIISPTFTIIRQHKNFYHIDLYRIEGENNLKELGLQELFSNKDNMVIIEWAEKLGTLLPEKRIDIYFSAKNEGQREISMNKYG